MARAKKVKPNSAQTSFLENYGHTAPAVPALRQAVKEWRNDDYKGATKTSQRLLEFWFYEDHKLPDGRLFRYHDAQREAVETLIYTHEVAGIRSQKELYERFIPADLAGRINLPEYDLFARYCIKMATGSGKTKVMTLAIAWQYLNTILEGKTDYATTFLLIAPNVIVFERLKSDFAGGRIFRADPIVPSDLALYWDMQCYVRGEAERASSEGAVYVTNIQQLYEGKAKENEEPDIMTLMLGSKPPAQLSEQDNFRERIAKRGGRVLVLNDEAHHTHEDDNAWNNAVRALHDQLPDGLAAQLDFTATPRYTRAGSLFEWTISDYPLKQAILDRIVKRPVKGNTSIGEVASNVPQTRFGAYIHAGVERWREYRDLLEPLGKKPLLFIMMNDTAEADAIGDHLQKKYPNDFGGDKTLIIHTKRNGEIIEKELEKARKAVAEVDRPTSPVRAIVSVLMLREGWDVQNVTVIVGLRPYTSKANILPEQTIGRGLRLMFRNITTEYEERVDIVGNPGFIGFIEKLEEEEQIDFETWEVGKDKLVITTIQAETERAEFDIAIPALSPILERSTAIAAHINALNVRRMRLSTPLPRKQGTSEEQTFRYEGMDILTLEKLFERTYTLSTPQTSQEMIGYYANAIAQELKLPGHFAYIAPKVSDFMRYIAFGAEVNLDDPAILNVMNRIYVRNLVIKVFREALAPYIVEAQEPRLEQEGRPLSTITPFPWSQRAPVCRKTVFNKVPCDNTFEEEFARFLDRAEDVERFGKLPMNFGFSIAYTDTRGNLRHYYPDFVAVTDDGTHFLLETKGREDTDVAAKDRSALVWAESASKLTGTVWRYAKVLEKEFRKHQPDNLIECVLVATMQLEMEF